MFSCLITGCAGAFWMFSCLITGCAGAFWMFSCFIIGCAGISCCFNGFNFSCWGTGIGVGCWAGPWICWFSLTGVFKGCRFRVVGMGVTDFWLFNGMPGLFVNSPFTWVKEAGGAEGWFLIMVCWVITFSGGFTPLVSVPPNMLWVTGAIGAWVSDGALSNSGWVSLIAALLTGCALIKAFLLTLVIAFSMCLFL